MVSLFLAAALALAGPADASPGFRLAFLGDPAGGFHAASLAVRFAVDIYNASSDGRAHPVQLASYPVHGSTVEALQAAKKIRGDPGVLGVLIHGEEGVDQAVLDVLTKADLAAVALSSWRAPRPPESSVTWLCPGQDQMASLAADCARGSLRASQAAVVDNGAATAAAAAKAFASRFRALGGKVDYRSEWQGSDWGLTRTVKQMRSHWPQVVFFVGEAGEAGRLARAMRGSRELRDARLFGLPALMEPLFFGAAGLAARASLALFPAPEFRGQAHYQRITGRRLPRTSPAYRAYATYAPRKPGRWPAMAYDGAAMLLNAAASAAGRRSGKLPGRREVLAALAATDAYRGIRGQVRFSQRREPAAATAMLYYALPEVNSKVMRWYGKEFGPPFR